MSIYKSWESDVMKRMLILAVMMLTLVGVLAACGEAEIEKKESNDNKSEEKADKKEDKKDKEKDKEKKKESESEKEKETNDELSVEEQYQGILDEYSKLIEDKTPQLIEEYKSEAKSNGDGLEGLAQLSNDKVTELAEISNEGVQKMADIMLTKGSGEYSEYEDWAEELMDVYLHESEKIMDVYLESAM